LATVGTTGYQNTLKEIRDDVRAILMERSANSFWDDEDNLNPYINMVLDDMRLRGIVTQKKWSSVSTSGTQQITPPATAWKIARIDYDDERLRELTATDMDTLTGGDWDSLSGSPEGWYDDGTYIYFDKKPSASAKVINVYYWEHPARLAADADLSGFLRIFTHICVYGVAAMALTADENAQAPAWEAKYERACERAQYHIAKLHESDSPTIRDHVGWGGMN
jgi:hypothetical protein